MVRKAQRPNRGRAQVAITRPIPAPIGGWDTQSPLAEMPIQNAVKLDNAIPRAGFVEIRRGFVGQQTGSPAAVESMMAFRGGASGDKLFAASGGGIYDVTTSGIPWGGALVSGFASNRWNETMFANAAGQWLIALNGVDTPQGYNAGAWGALPAISGSSGSITLNPNNLFAATPHKGRLLFLEANSLHVWFPAAGAVGGVCQLLDLGSVFNKGGRLVAAATWSWQFGVTADDFAIFMTDQGQIAVFSGVDPANAADWQLTGVYDFGPPVGTKALIKYGADLIVVTSDGIIPLSQALKLDRDEQDSVALTAKIKDGFAKAVRAYNGNYGWQGILYPGDTTSNDPDAPGGSLTIFNVPTQTLATSMQFVQNSATGAWCRFLNLNAFCWELANSKIYFGSTNGVYQWDLGASDNGQPITAEVKSAFSAFETPSNKRFTAIRPLLNTSGLVQPAIDIDVDFRDNPPTAVPSVVGQGSAAVGIRYDWTSASGVGEFGAAHMLISIQDDPSQPLLATDPSLANVLGVDASDSLATQSGLPYDVPCQVIGFDVAFIPGGPL